MQTKETMNEICYSLSKDIINPHKHVFGGDYDANVMMIALQNCGFRVEWHDNRTPVNLKMLEEDGTLVGLIINTKKSSSLFLKMFKLSGRHWSAIKKYNDMYYLMDSQESGPTLLGSLSQADSRVNDMNVKGTEILLVYKANNS
jgi:hypothetical protein